jgi:SAM-dependent methyltransferase
MSAQSGGAGDATDEARRDAFAARILQSVLGAFDLFSVYLGERLGLYAALAAGAATAADVADRAGCDARYVREWLEHQAVSGLLEAHATDGGARRYALPPEHAEVLLAQDSLSYLAPVARLAAGVLAVTPRVLDAYRTGAGIPYADYGADMREGQAGANRAMFLELIAGEWFPAVPDLHARLRHAPARVADIGCGAAWSSIGIARAYPQAVVDAFDLDEASVDLARANVAAHGLDERVRVQLADASDPALAGVYDVVTVFEALHDMARPVAALETVRRILAPRGFALVVDERVAEEFTAPGDDIERLMYGWSIFHCLPSSRAETPSAATGTVMRPATLRAYAQEAGFKDIEVLPVEHEFFRFYRLLP